MAKTDQKTGEALGTGRRKSSVARVRVKDGSGTITINGKSIEQFYVNEQDRRAVVDTLKAVGVEDKVDTRVVVNGGGVSGQSGACLLYTSPSPRDQRGSRMPSSA